MASFLPTNLELIEFIGTTGTTVTVVPETAVPPALQDAITITNVTYQGTKVPDDLEITWDGDSFTFSSKFDDQFSRTLKYLVQDSDRTKHYYSVSKFSDVPDEITGLYRYIPPATDYMDIDFLVSWEGTESGSGSGTWTLTLRHDWEASRDKFIELVHSGSSYKQALETYPELSL